MATNGLSLTHSGTWWNVLEDLVVGAGEQRAPRTPRSASPKKNVLEHHAGEQRADRQDEQRHQHHRRRFMGVVHHVGEARGLPWKVMKISRQE
jgi:hypothetical protein